MKKIYMLIGLVIVILGCIFLIKGDKKDKDKNIKDNNSSQETNQVYKIRYSILEKDDGEYYEFSTTTFNDGNDTSTYMDGCDLKPESTDIKVPKSLRNNDFDKIEDFFNKHQFKEKITLEDLKGLKLEKLDKNDILNMFNETIEKEFDASVSGLHIPYCSFGEDYKTNGYKVFMGLLAERLGLDVLRIDLVYDNDVYLSDLVKNNKATAEQRTIYENLQKISKYVVENQEFEVKDKFDFKGEVYNRVYDMIRMIDDNKEKENE